MKNLFSRMFRLVVEWFRPSHRIQTEQPISPAEFQKMLARTLADPEFKLLLLKSIAGTVFPIQGATCANVTATSSTPGQLAKWDGSCDLADSVVTESSGNIGIGMTPDEKLSVNGVSHLGNDVLLTRTDGFWGAFLTVDNSTTTSINLSKAGGGNINYISLYANTIYAAGNVGVGTTSPGEKLEVDGNIKISAGSGGEIIFQDGSVQTKAAGCSGSGTAHFITMYSADTVIGTSSIYEDPTTHNVGIGTMTPASYALLEVAGTILTSNSSSGYANIEISKSYNNVTGDRNGAIHSVITRTDGKGGTGHWNELRVNSLGTSSGDIAGVDMTVAAMTTPTDGSGSGLSVFGRWIITGGPRVNTSPYGISGLELNVMERYGDQGLQYDRTAVAKLSQILTIAPELNVPLDTDEALGYDVTYGIAVSYNTFTKSDGSEPNVTNVTSGSGGVIQVTLDTALPSNFVNGSVIVISGVQGTTEANGAWKVTVINSSTFTLNGSTFTHAYTPNTGKASFNVHMHIPLYFSRSCISPGGTGICMFGGSGSALAADTPSYAAAFIGPFMGGVDFRNANLVGSSASYPAKSYNPSDPSTPVSDTALPAGLAILLGHQQGILFGGVAAMVGYNTGIVTLNGAFNATTGYLYNGGATLGNYLRGNGMNFVSSALLPSDFGSLSGNQVLASPNGSSGTPSFRALVSNDIPNLPATQITSGSFASNLFGNGISTAAGINAGSYSVGGAEIIGNLLSTGTGRDISTDGAIHTSNCLIAEGAASSSSAGFVVASSFSGSPKISMNTSNGNIGTLEVVNAVNGFEFNGAAGFDSGSGLHTYTQFEIRGGIITNAA